MSGDSNSFVLDTSALLAMIEAEEGGRRVLDILAKHKVLVPFAALLELRYVTLRERGPAEADQRYALLKRTQAQLLWNMDEPTVLTAARLKASYHISLGDAMIAAYAIRHEAVLVHKDPELEPLANEVRLEMLPFKRRSS